MITNIDSAIFMIMNRFAVKLIFLNVLGKLQHRKLLAIGQSPANVWVSSKLYSCPEEEITTHASAFPLPSAA